MADRVFTSDEVHEGSSTAAAGTPISSEDTPSSNIPQYHCHGQRVNSQTSNDSAFSDVDYRDLNATVAYSCDCDEKCSIDDFASGKCQNSVPRNCTFPYLNTQNLSETEKQELIARLEEDFKEVHLKYASLTYSLRNSLRDRQITPAVLADCLMDVDAISLKMEAKCKLRDHYEDIKNAKDITKVFEILRDHYSSFFNYDIITFIMNELGCDDVKEKHASYEACFHNYCKRHVFECPFYSQKNSKCSDIVVKLDGVTDLDRFTMSSLKRFQLRLAEMLGIKNRVLRVCGVEKGCIQICLQIPAIFEKVIFPLSPETERQLQQLRIKTLKCGDYCFPCNDHPKAKVIIITIMLPVLVYVLCHCCIILLGCQDDFSKERSGQATWHFGSWTEHESSTNLKITCTPIISKWTANLLSQARHEGVSKSMILAFH